MQRVDALPKACLRVVPTCINPCIYLRSANRVHSGAEMHYRFLCYRTLKSCATLCDKRKWTRTRARLLSGVPSRPGRKQLSAGRCG